MEKSSFNYTMYNKIKENISCLIDYVKDYRQLDRSLSDKFALANLERQMLLLSHALEKGMSFKTKKANWGGGKCKNLCILTEKYINLSGTISNQLILTINVLNSYLHDEFACKDSDLVYKINELKSQYVNLISPELTGLKYVSEPPQFDVHIIEEFFNSRNSVRYFSKQPITEFEILTASRFASCTPTACNRQSSKVYAFRDRESIRLILDNQLGDQGWCSNADTLFVITGIQTYFGSGYERCQVYVDGGLFAMNFDYGLHLQHIGSCFKMYVRDHNREKEFKKLCNIPENEIPIVLILAGHYQNEPIQSPKSHRFNVPTYLDGIEINK